jgi:hypothetical protein
MSNSKGIELAQLLTSLRSEINKARLDGQGKDVRFRIDGIELELQVTVERSAETNGGVRFWVASLGGKGGVTSGETHVVRLSLTAETSAGGSVLTGDSVAGLLADD